MPPARRTPAGPRFPALRLALVLAVAAAARLAGWARVFRADGVHFAADSDPHYHVLQAERFLRSGLAALWHDPLLGWPQGADVPWPPLFDVSLGAVARALYGAGLDRAALEQVAAWLPVVLGVVTVALVAMLAAALLDRRAAIGAALLFALLPAHVLYSGVGRADQHVAEILLACWVQGAFVATWAGRSERARRAGMALAAAGLALSFWTWMGSALQLVVPVAFTAGAHVLLGREAEVTRRIARGLLASFGGAAVLLAGTLVLWGPPGALLRGSVLGLTGLQVALLVAGASSGALLLARSRREGQRTPAARLAEAALALLVPAVALLLVPSLRAGIAAGATALFAGNPWYADIAEFRPLLFSCQTPLEADVGVLLRFYGLALPAALLAIPPLLRRWRRDEDRPRVLFLALWTATFLVLALARRRFAPYLAAPLALCAWEGVRHAAGALAARWWPARPSAAPLLAAAGAVAILLPCLPSLRDVPRLPDDWIEAARWLGRQPRAGGEEGVLGAWELGHLVRYYGGGRPAVATPFGTEGGAGAMEAVARFDLGPGGEAEALLHARRARWVMMLDPVVRAYSEASLLGASFGVRMERSCSAAEGKVDSVSAEFLATTGARLFYFDGGSAPEFPAPPIDALRLVYESPPSPMGAGAPSRQVKTFERVPGATLDVTGAGPDRPVRASVQVRTNQGRIFTWSTAARADAAGRARLRLPYATGGNGAVEASAWVLSGGGREVALVLDARQVAQGERVRVDLGGEPQQGGADPARTRP